MRSPKKTPRTPAIRQLVDHNLGPTELSRRLEGAVVYQEIQRWLKRGWASPMQFLRLEPFLPPKLTLRDLHEDVPAKGSAARAAAKTR